MSLFESMTADGHEEVVFWHDRVTGLRAIVAIHDTTLGPGLGGTRMLPYPTEQAALEDVLRLSKAMTYKNAAAGLDFGGGKGVIIGDPARDKSEALFRAYGRFVEGLGGRYVTTTDVGTMTPDLDIMRSETRYVTGTSPAFGGSGDTSILTGRTVYQGMRAAALEAWGTPELRGRTVAVQGAGKVGWHLMELLHADGAAIIVTDTYEAAVHKAVVAFGARPTSADAIYDADCDVFSPNALGGSISEQTAARLHCKVVCGGANNQLATPADMQRLTDRGILYAPDFIVNSGGVINIADETMGYNRDRAFAKGDGVFETTRRIFAIAREQAISTEAAAEHFAETRMQTLNAVHRTLVPGRSPIPR